MQGRSRAERDLWDAGEVTGHLVAPGSVFAFLAEHRRELFPEQSSRRSSQGPVLLSYRRAQVNSSLLPAARC